MKLGIDPDKITSEEIGKIANEDLIQNVCKILKLEANKKASLKKAIGKAYDEFLDSYYQVEQSAPEHVENEALKNVHMSAQNLLDALNNLLSVGNADKRLAESLKKNLWYWRSG